jgi:hypothetical protein
MPAIHQPFTCTSRSLHETRVIGQLPNASSFESTECSLPSCALPGRRARHREVSQLFQHYVHVRGSQGGVEEAQVSLLDGLLLLGSESQVEQLDCCLVLYLGMCRALVELRDKGRRRLVTNTHGASSLSDEQPKKAHLPMLARPAGSSIACSDEQPSKAHSPMLVRPAGSSMACSNEQPLKANLPMLVRPAGSSMACSDEQPAKARQPMLVRPAGSSMACSDEQQEKAQ